MKFFREMVPWNGLPLLIFGTSGISKEVETIVEEINRSSYEKQFDFLGFVSEKADEVGNEILGYRVVCSDESFEKYISNYIQIGVVIPFGTPSIKKRLVEKIKLHSNLVYPNIISPSAKIMDKARVKMGIGNIICSGCILTTEISMGNFNLINLSASVGHNVFLGNYGVINPLSAISGNVVIQDEVLLGAGCAVKQGITVKRGSIVGMGAIVVKDVEEDAVLVCKAAERMR